MMSVKGNKLKINELLNEGRKDIVVKDIQELSDSFRVRLSGKEYTLTNFCAMIEQNNGNDNITIEKVGEARYDVYIQKDNHVDSKGVAYQVIHDIIREFTM